MGESESLTASEQRGILLDLARWLRKVVPAGIKVSIANMCDDARSLSLVPIKGAIVNKRYACGGFEAYMPFALYYRTPATDNESNSAAFGVLDSIGIVLEGGSPPIELTEGRQLLEAFQDSTAVKFKQTGSIGDFMANYVIIYAREDKE